MAALSWAIDSDKPDDRVHKKRRTIPRFKHEPLPLEYMSEPTKTLPKRDSFVFDEDIHLQIEPPSHIVDLEFQKLAYPLSEKNQENFCGLAFTEPFRVLSDEGLSVIHQIIEKNKDRFRQNPRNKPCRGMGHTSTFMRQLAFSPRIVQLISQIAQERLVPHNMYMNIAHTNLGEVGVTHQGKAKKVEEWHTDSVDYVMVVILSDTTDMEGGELKVLQIVDDSNMMENTHQTFERFKVTGIPAELVQNVNYKAPGYCIVMQGSQIMHSVSPVTKAKVPRLSMVNSYQRLDVFSQDMTRYTTFRDQTKDPENVLQYEFARHKAWRIHGKMDYIMKVQNYDTPFSDVLDVLRKAEEEIVRTRKVLTGEIVSDSTGWVTENERVPPVTSGSEGDSD